MSDKKKAAICIIVFLVCFVVGITAVMIINRVHHSVSMEEIDPPTIEEEREAFLALSRDERAAVLMEAIWGEDFWDIIVWNRNIKSPWPNISLERTRVMSLNELEIVTYIILENEPYLGSIEDHVWVPIADGLYVDLREELHTFSDFSFRYPRSSDDGLIKVTCRRDGVLLNYEYSFSE